MTAYLLTEQEHKQLLDMLAYSHLGAYTMLKAMKHVEPVAIVAKDGFAQISVGWRKVVAHNTELYALGDTA